MASRSGSRSCTASTAWGATDTETGDHHAVVAGTLWIATPGTSAELIAFRGMRVMRVVAPAVR
ncbi:MAG: hypothetical protein IPK12_24480 [Gemmatimonadetes bacterium]|nr:hypothetical protein [Gemmatimonadota bacterium]